MKHDNWLSDLEVEEEIERLKESEYVALARKEQRLQYKRRQILYNLRNLEKKGKALAAQGVTIENVERMLEEDEDEKSFED